MTVLLPLKEGIMNCSAWKLEVYSSENISSAGDCHSSLSGSWVGSSEACGWHWHLSNWAASKTVTVTGNANEIQTLQLQWWKTTVLTFFEKSSIKDSAHLLCPPSEDSHIAGPHLLIPTFVGDRLTLAGLSLTLLDSNNQEQGRRCLSVVCVSNFNQATLHLRS